MVGSRMITALVGVGISLVVSILLWLWLDTLAVFLFVPFVPFLFRGFSQRRVGSAVRECPACGFETCSTEFEYCPRDGHRLK